jgi:hypothetical protein
MVKAKKKKPTTSSKPVAKKKVQPPDRSEISAGELIGLFADEIQEVYHVFNHRIDRMNAEEKARMLVLKLLYGDGGSRKLRVTEKNFKVPLCKEHKED